MRINITSGHEIRQPSKSQNHPPTRRTQQTQPQPPPVTPVLRQFLRHYRKEVELPVSYQTSIHEGRGQQRCMTHNNPLIHYCPAAKQLLCQHCQFNQASILPLQEAHQPVASQLSAAIGRIESEIFPKIDDLVRQNSLNLARLEKQMGQVTASVMRFYQELAVELAFKKNQHIRKYQQLWMRLKQKYSTNRSELSRIKQYMLDRTCQIEERRSEDSIIFNHNVASALANFQKIDTAPLAKYEVLDMDNVIKAMQEAALKLKEALNFDYTLCQEEAEEKEAHPVKFKDKECHKPTTPTKKQLHKAKSFSPSFTRSQCKSQTKPQKRQGPSTLPTTPNTQSTVKLQNDKEQSVPRRTPNFFPRSRGSGVTGEHLRSAMMEDDDDGMRIQI